MNLSGFILGISSHMRIRKAIVLEEYQKKKKNHFKVFASFSSESIFVSEAMVSLSPLLVLILITL